MRTNARSDHKQQLVSLLLLLLLQEYVQFKNMKHSCSVNNGMQYMF